MLTYMNIPNYDIYGDVKIIMGENPYILYHKDQATQ